MRFIQSLLVLLLISFSVSALDVVSSIGFDAQQRFLSAEKGFGDNLLAKKYLQGALYGNVQFNELIGFEIGYQAMNSKQLHKTLFDPSNYFNHTVDDFAPGVYIAHSKLAMKGLYAGLTSSLSISSQYPLKVIGTLGFSRAQAKISSYVDFVAPGASPEDLWIVNFAQRKLVPRAGAGLQYMVSNHLGIRAMGIWEQTARFKRMPGIYHDGAPSSFVASLKNSITTSVGLFYSF